ncbi:MAG: hypothetical protein R2682_02035 [Pyrinomonadaceae bacterium]
MAALLPVGTNSGCELYCEAQTLGLSNGASVASFTDQSGKARDLTAASSRPTFQTAVLNGKAVVRWSGSQNPLVNAASIPGVRCGWIVAKYTGATFAIDYPGLLTSMLWHSLLLGTPTGGNLFFDPQLIDPTQKFEFRSNDRIYAHDAAPGPMNAFKLIFFRLWNPITMDGISLGQDRDFTARKWLGDVALAALYSRTFTEEEIRAYTKVLADNFALTLADVYEYQADTTGHDESPEQAVNFYDPPEGDRISEAIDDSKRVIDLKFSAAGQEEVKYMKAFHAGHYPTATPFFYRDYRVTPPEDIECYFDSQYELAGYGNDSGYAFTVRER